MKSGRRTCNNQPLHDIHHGPEPRTVTRRDEAERRRPFLASKGKAAGTPEDFTRRTGNSPSLLGAQRQYVYSDQVKNTVGKE